MILKIENRLEMLDPNIIELCDTKWDQHGLIRVDLLIVTLHQRYFQVMY